MSEQIQKLKKMKKGLLAFGLSEAAFEFVLEVLKSEGNALCKTN